MKLNLTLLPALWLAVFTAPATAQIEGAPALIDYQGRLLDAAGAPLAPGSPANYQVDFRIWNQLQGGSVVWAERQVVTVLDGEFSVRLGEGVAFDGLPRPAFTEVFAPRDRFLGVTVAVPGQTPAEIAPRLAFLSVPYALVAERAKLADTATAAVSAQTADTATTATTAATATYATSAANAATADVALVANALAGGNSGVINRLQYGIQTYSTQNLERFDVGSKPLTVFDISRSDFSALKILLPSVANAPAGTVMTFYVRNSPANFTFIASVAPGAPTVQDGFGNELILGGQSGYRVTLVRTGTAATAADWRVLSVGLN